MIKIIGIAGSLRQGSFNAGLLRAAAELAPDNCSVDTASIKGIPLYDGDLEVTEGIPGIVSEIKDRISESDGLLLVTPEYNNSIPGVFKNAIDWLSRPPGDQPGVFGNKPVGLMGASPGPFGTGFSQTAWLQVLRVLNMRIWFGQKLYLKGALDFFDTSGNLVDEKIRKRVRSYMTEFAAFVESQK